MVHDVLFDMSRKTGTEPGPGPNRQSMQNDPTHQISDGVRTQDDLHIDIELPPDGTMTKNMLQGPLEWQEQKYGEDAKMDPKKEERLQWLIDKKKRKK